MRVVLGISVDRKFTTVNLSCTSDFFFFGRAVLQVECFNDFCVHVRPGIDVVLRIHGFRSKHT